MPIHIHGHRIVSITVSSTHPPSLLGRGTSPRDGATLAGALLEHLDQLQCLSIFATHLYTELKELPLTLPHTVDKTLRVDQEGNKEHGMRWTYQLESGLCEASLAVATAERQGVPKAALDRVRELMDIQAQMRAQPTNTSILLHFHLPSYPYLCTF